MQDVRKAILDDFDKRGKEAGLKGFEQVGELGFVFLACSVL